MLTITEHLWQSGAQNIEIINTILKIPEGSPQFYFYSKNRNKILRKKDQTLDYVIKQIETSNKTQQNQQFIVFSYYSNHNTIALYNIQQVYEALSNPSKYSYAIICLNHLKQPLRLINLTYSNEEITSIKPFLNISKINQPFTLEQQEEIEDYVKLFCRRMEERFYKEHNKQYRVKRLNLVVNYFTQGIKVLWSQKIQFLEKNTKQTPFLSFNYDFKQYQQNPTKSKQTSNIIFKLDIQSEISSICQSNDLRSNKQVQRQQTCFGCGKQTTLEKQIHVSSVIQIRTLYQMPLKGLMSEYYLVCNDCYLLN